VITAALNTVTVSNYPKNGKGTERALYALTAEIAARVVEMNEIKLMAGTDIIARLGLLQGVNSSAFATIIALLHGDVSVIVDSYSVQAERRHGREKQTMHCQMTKDLKDIQALFPEAGAVLQSIRRSVQHHEDPQSSVDVIRESMN